MKAIYLDWESGEACGTDEIVVFSDDNDPNIAKLYKELSEGWPDKHWIVDNYNPPRLNPRNIEECAFSADFLAKRVQPVKAAETVAMPPEKNIGLDELYEKMVNSGVFTYTGKAPESVAEHCKELAQRGYHEGEQVF